MITLWCVNGKDENCNLLPWNIPRKCSSHRTFEIFRFSHKPVCIRFWLVKNRRFCLMILNCCLPYAVSIAIWEDFFLKSVFRLSLLCKNQCFGIYVKWPSVIDLQHLRKWPDSHSSMRTWKITYPPSVVIAWSYLDMLTSCLLFLSVVEIRGCQCPGLIERRSFVWNTSGKNLESKKILRFKKKSKPYTQLYEKIEKSKRLLGTVYIYLYN